ncbi:Holliday junction resolvase RuvX [Kribbella pittospori]|uniref:Putative pre-16S rRNA nuclease n=2 Tax=Kribbella TaxID=182639 RepID=A0A4R0JPC8_9ACTN|nr:MULTISPECIES: Holliday junction resolvase RuvX [Kribbella]TCC48619.1 Holliday junction resolvase RuvX [Kribbella capetownensis]TCC62998.1 Holliday junction resolvase RuvX [Kribbella pittospori]
MRRGVRLALDIGDARIGVASSDPHGILATPVETVRRGPGDLDRIAALAAELEAVEIVVGLPRSLSGGEGPAAVKIRETAEQVRDKVREGNSGPEVRLVDERFTTVTAERMLRERGKKGSKRRAVVDQAAAVVILQHALDLERESGNPPGRPL